MIETGSYVAAGGGTTIEWAIAPTGFLRWEAISAVTTRGSVATGRWRHLTRWGARRRIGSHLVEVARIADADLIGADDLRRSS